MHLEMLRLLGSRAPRRRDVLRRPEARRRSGPRRRFWVVHV